MVERNTMTQEEMRAQETVTLGEVGFIPATVHDHTRHRDGMTLHTIGDNENSDIAIYDDGRPPHRVGNPPEAE